MSKAEMTEGTIIDVSYEDEMKQSYLDYSLSVILSRALPDVRDGLKPVQRRILYDMRSLGLFSDKPHRKSARIVGDTMGRFHPHGDSSIYDALVVLSRDYKNTHPLVDGQGNFGSIEGDPAAAMRYTESKLTPYAQDILLSDLDLDVVDAQLNYDDEEEEPVVLPAKLPNLLINGSEGIAVGMTTSIPTHNVGEVIDACAYLMMHPGAGEDKLLSLMPGPDFPTGGVISNQDELSAIYKTGTGRIRVRGKTVFEKGKRGKRDRLVVTEIPYTMVGNEVGKFLQTSEQLMLDGTLSDVLSISNQSTSEAIRFVFELKKGADVNYIESILYTKTNLEGTFPVSMLAISDYEPVLYTIKTLLQAFIDFLYEVYHKRYRTLLRRAEKEKEATEGLVHAMDVLDVILEVIRASKSVKVARDILLTGNLGGIKLRTKTSERIAQKFSFTRIQADEILGLRLAKLVGLEIEQLHKKYKDVLARIASYENLLADRDKMRKKMRADMLSYKKVYATPRKTELVQHTITVKEKEVPEKNLICLIDRFGYVNAVQKNTYERYKDAVNGDNAYRVSMTNKERLLVFTDQGNAHVIRAEDIPQGRVRDKGEPLDNISNYVTAEERIAGVFSLKEKDTRRLLFVSSDGYVKHVAIREFDTNYRTILATRLNEKATLCAVLPYTEEHHVVLGSNDGHYIRFRAEEVPSQRRNARGATGIRLNKKANCTQADIVEARGGVTDVQGEEVAASSIRLSARGRKGTKIR